MMKEFDSQKLINTLKNTFLVIFGTTVLAFGTAIFIIPFDLVTGGVSGIGIILHRLFSGVPFLSELSTALYASVVNWILFLLGFIFLGKSFAVKTLVSTAVYPLALSLASYLMESEGVGSFLNLLSDNYVSYGSITIIIATVFGGAMIGAGCALTFLGGGSTGGVDVITLIICKFHKRIKSSLSFFIVDSAIVLIGLFVINNLVVTLLGITSAFICAIAIDRMFIGESKALVAHIVSEKYAEINDLVINVMGRTTTIADVKGGYSGLDKKLVMVTFPMNRYAEFIALMKSVDKTAFITVHRAHEINGEGWTYDAPDSVNNA